MDGRRRLHAVPATQALATIVRQFAGSRVERQIVARVFDLAWLSAGGSQPESCGDDGVAAARGLEASLTNVVLVEGVWP